MNEIKFTNALDEIDPKRLVGPKNDDKVGEFFLVLGVFYNDLKSLVFHLRQLEVFFQDTPKDVPSPKNGEFGGMKIHLERLMVSIVYEFLNFLEKNTDVMDTTEFKLLLGALKKDLQEKWDLLRQIAKDEKKLPKSNFGKALYFIRNKTAFHYDPKIISKGFVDYYYVDKKHFGNKIAYYNIGETMESTRFYYCDGAVQRSTRSQIEKFMEPDLFMKDLSKTISNLNFSLMYLLKEYIRQRPHLTKQCK